MLPCCIGDAAHKRERVYTVSQGTGLSNELIAACDRPGDREPPVGQPDVQ